MSVNNNNQQQQHPRVDALIDFSDAAVAVASHSSSSRLADSHGLLDAVDPSLSLSDPLSLLLNPSSIATAATPSAAQNTLSGLSFSDSLPVSDLNAAPPNSLSIDIKHDNGVLSIIVGDLMAKLERLDRLQSMFNELEKNYKKTTKTHARVNEILGKYLFTVLPNGVAIGNESDLITLDAFLKDQSIKAAEYANTTKELTEKVDSLKKHVAVLKEENRVISIEADASAQKVMELEIIIKDHEKQIQNPPKDFQSNQQPTQNTSSPRKSHPTTPTSILKNNALAPISTSSSTTTASTPSFFNFQTLMPQSASTTTSASPTAAPTTPTRTSTDNTHQDPSASPTSAASTLQMKQRIRDLAIALKKVTTQRDAAIDKIRHLQDPIYHHHHHDHKSSTIPNTSTQHSPTTTPTFDDLLHPTKKPHQHTPSESERLSTNSYTGSIVSANIVNSETISRGEYDTLFAAHRELQSTHAALQSTHTALKNSKRIQQISDTQRTSSYTNTSRGSNNVDDGLVTGIEQDLLESREQCISLQQALSECEAQLKQALRDFEKVSGELVGVRGLLEGRQAAVDAMAQIGEVTVQTLEGDLEKCRREVEALKKVEKNLDATCRELRERCEGFEKRVGELDGILVQEKSEKEDLREMLKGAEKVRGDAVKECEDLRARVKKVEKELEVVKVKLSATETAHEAALSKLQMNSGSVSAMQEKMQASEAKEKEAVVKLDKAFAVIRKLKGEVEAAGKEAGVLQKQYEEEVRQVKLLVEESEKRCGNLQREVDELKASESAVPSDAVNQISKLTAQVDKLTRLNEMYKSSTPQQPVTNHDDSLEAHKERIRHLESQLQNPTTHSTQTQSDPLSAIEESQSQKKCTHENVRQLEETIETLRRKLDAVIPKEMTSGKNFESVQSELLLVTAKLAAAESLKKEAEAKLKSEQDAHKETVLKVDKAYAVVRKMRSDADSRAKEAEVMKNGLEEQVQSLKSALETAVGGNDDRIEELETRNVSLTAQVSEMEAQVVELRDSLAASKCTHDNFDAMAKELEELRAQVPLVDMPPSTDASLVELKQVKAKLSEIEIKLVQVESEKRELERQLVQQQTSIPAALPTDVPTSASPKYSSVDVEALIDKDITDLKKQFQSTQDALALLKQENHANLESLASKEILLQQTQTRLAEEEEKKNKSLQLLRNMKAKILKLEDMLSVRDSEVSDLRSELAEFRGNVAVGTAERDARVVQLSKQVDEMSARIRKQNDDLFQLEKTLESKNGELDALNIKVKQLNRAHDSAVAERDALKATEKSRMEEVGLSRQSLAMHSSQMSAFTERIKDLEFRIVNLDEELDTSKGLFEKKSVAYEELQLKMAELEKQYYETEQSVGNNASEVEELKREIIQLRRELTITTKSSREKDSLLNTLKQEKDVSDSLLANIEREFDMSKIETQRLRSKAEEFAALEENLNAAKNQIDFLKTSKELEITSRISELKTKNFEHEKQLDQAKLRETQLVKLNKSLKDEVRKLAKVIGITTPNTSPPLSHQNSGIEASEIVAANTNSPDMTATGVIARRMSLSSQLDLSGSSNGLNWGATIASGIGSKSAHMYTPVGNHRRDSMTIASPTTPTNLGGSSSTVKLAANEEYLKNVILRFFESKRDTKAQMIPALGMLLRLTPDEVKRVQKSI